MSQNSVIGERIVPERFTVAKKQYLLYLRHLFVYDWAIGRLPEGASVLEVGCGEGYGASMLARRARTVTGLDMNRRAVEHARARYGAGNIDFTAYDGGRFPFDDGSFDAAVCFQVIEHVDDDEAFVEQIHRVLSPGGMLMMTTPNRLLRLAPGQKPWNRYHRREYGPDDLRDVLEKYFSKVDVHGVVGAPEVQQALTTNLRAANPLAAALKKHMSERLKLSLLRIKSVLPRFLGGDRRKEFMDKYSFRDFSVVAGNEEVAASLDLIAVCRK